MKIISYRSGEAIRAGLVCGEYAADLQDAGREFGEEFPQSARGLLEGGDELLSAARRVELRIAAMKDTRPQWLMPLESVTLAPPVPDPQKIIALGFNYRSHVEEQKAFFKKPIETPSQPVVFAKYASALAGPNDAIVLPPFDLSNEIDFECELVAVIGKTTRNVSEADALNCVAGYMVMNDVSARDCQFSDRQFTRAKSFDTFAPCGPWIVTADELEGAWPLRLWTDVNGGRMQESNSDDMIFPLAYIISYLSRGMTLVPGDLIATGTPAGVGKFRTPPRLLKSGDIVECGIEKIGTIINRCR